MASRRYVSTTTKKPYQLLVAAGPDGQSVIKSVGTTARITKPNVRCGASWVHVIDEVRGRANPTRVNKRCVYFLELSTFPTGRPDSHGFAQTVTTCVAGVDGAEREGRRWQVASREHPAAVQQPWLCS